jgi:outer membrane protein OmpA-like peptidoglycan-associated protein
MEGAWGEVAIRFVFGAVDPLREESTIAVVAVLALALIVAPGCVTKKLFRSNVEDTDGRVTAVENAVESNERKIGDLKNDTDRRLGSVDQKAAEAASLGTQALSKAESAEKAAQGKLLWTVTITDDKVRFPFGEAQVSSDAASALDGLISKVKSYGKALYIEVEGHTDNVGDEQFNLMLSEDRALAVRNYLNQNGGIPLHAMNTIAFGEEKPIADNSSKDGRAQNRRVVIRVLE